MVIMATIRSTCLIIRWQSSMMKKSKTFLIIKGTEGGFSPRERGEQGGMRLNQNLILETNSRISNKSFHLEQVKHSKPVFSGCARW